MALNITLNGQLRALPDLAPGAVLIDVIAMLGLKEDRIAVEHNGEIVSRKAWNATRVGDRDRLEIVHFVGGGVLSIK